jgi:hypothetical protein
MDKDYSFFRYLYNEDLYLIKPSKKAESVTLRGNVIIVEYPGISTLPTKEKMLLNKILEAVKLKPVQVSIVNLSEIRNRISTRSQIHFENARVVLFTGKIPVLTMIGQTDKKYEIIRDLTNDYVLADTLEMIEQDKILKKNLWDVLQMLFPQS